MSETKSAAPVTGRCLCGAVSYESASEQVLGGHCHCVDCRKASGTGHGSHLGVPSAAFKVTGKTTAFDITADSGNTVTRHFCPTCGSPIYSTNPGMGDMVFIRASSLDDPEVFKPQVVVYTKSRPSWDVTGEGLPAFEGMPPSLPKP